MNLLGGGVVLDKLAILHVVASAHPVDLLVHFSPEERALVLIWQKNTFSSISLLKM